MMEKAMQIIESFSVFDSILILYLIFLILLLLVQDGTLKKEQLRDFLHQLIVEAEHEINGTKKGRERKKYVIEIVRKSLPPWLQLFVTDALINNLVQWAFDSAIKVTTPDGRTVAVAAPKPQGTKKPRKPRAKKAPSKTAENNSSNTPK